MSQRNMHRTALLLMVGSGILLTAGNGTDAYPIVGYSQAVAASEDSTGILLEQSVQGLEILHDLVERNHGQIDVQPGEGSFRVDVTVENF